MNVRKARRMPAASSTFEYFLDNSRRALTCVRTITRGVAKSDSNNVGIIQKDKRMSKRVIERAYRYFSDFMGQRARKIPVI